VEPAIKSSHQRKALTLNKAEVFMKDDHQTNQELIQELDRMRQRIIELEANAAKYHQEKEKLDNELDKEREYIAQVLDTTDCLVRNFAFTVLDTARAWVVVIDLQGRILHINRTCELETGYLGASLKGHFFSNILLLPDKTNFLEIVFNELNILNQSLKQDQIINIDTIVAKYECNCVTKNGAIRRILWSTTPYINIDGSFKYLLCTGIDITEQHIAESALKESEERYRSLVEMSPDTIAICCDGKIVYINAAGIKLFGATSDFEILNLPILNLVHPDFRQVVQQRIQLLEKSGQQSPLAEMQILCINGQGLYVEVTGVRVEYMGKVAVQVVLRDINARKILEQEIIESEKLIRSLYQVAMNSQISLNEALFNVLAMGCQYFNLDYGLIAKVEESRYEIIAAKTPNNSINAKDIFDLRQVYCLETLQREDPLYIQHATASNWCRHPGYDGFQMETYIGMRIVVKGKVYGVLCFCSRIPSSRQFRSVDNELLKMMTQWIGSEIERYLAAEVLQRLQHQNELILNSAGDGICGVNSEGKITFINPAAAIMLGYQIEELINRSIDTILFRYQSEMTSSALEEGFLYPVLKYGRVQQDKEQVFWRSDGSSFPVECIATPMQEPKATDIASKRLVGGENIDKFIPSSSFVSHPDWEIIGAVITFRDITERQAIERMKDEFISVVSHELRTPLTSIRGALGLVAGGLLRSQPEKAQRMLEIAAANTDRLTRLINDILDIERIESGKVQMEKQVCNAAELMVQATDDMRVMAEKAGVRLVVVPIEARIEVDRDRIIQVLTNLISNAIKFSPADTTIEVDAEIAGQESRGVKDHQNSVSFANSNYILFKVKDQGRGIPDDKLETIFGRFQQVNSSDSRDKGGTGLGLAICRSIVQQHDGRIWVESCLGEGSSFYFTLHCKPPNDRLGDNPKSEIQNPKSNDSCGVPLPPLVLLCDDDILIHEPVKLLLSHQGYRVVAVASGKEAVDQAALLQPSVILLDLVMPEVDGWETMALLKEDPNTKNIPIIIFSALSPQIDESPTTEAFGWLPKPLTTASLSTIEQSLKQRPKMNRVLVVEDDADLARVLTMMFERHGIEAYHAQTGQEAIQMSQSVLPDLLLLDLVLPQGDGYAVVEWLRQHDCLHHVPLVIYSAKELHKPERDRLQLGPTEFFTKGLISPENFESRVLTLLNRIVSQSVP
jgi:PAS domain S-box-containing protein